MAKNKKPLKDKKLKRGNRQEARQSKKENLEADFTLEAIAELEGLLDEIDEVCEKLVNAKPK